MSLTIQTKRLFKFAAVIIFATALMIIFLPANVSAAEAPPAWNSYVDSGISGGTVEVEVTQYASGTINITDGATVTVVNDGSPVTVSSPLVLNIDSTSTVYWTADLTTGTTISGDFITFTGSGSVELNGADISGSATDDLVAIDSGDVDIIDSEINNSTGNGLEICGGTVTISGTTTIAGNTGIHVNGSTAVLSVQGGSISGVTGILIDEASTAAPSSITGGTIEGNYYGVCVYGSAAYTLIVNETNGDTEISGGACGIFVNNPNADVFIKGGNISGDIGMQIGRAAYSTVTVSGGTITGDYCGITVEGTTAYTLVVNNADGVPVINGDNAGIYITNPNADVYIKGGNISGGVGIVIEDANDDTVTVSGGTITGVNYGIDVTGEGTYTLIINENDGATIIRGGNSYELAGIVVNNPNADVEIAGGQISGGTALAINQITPNTITITGGTFEGTYRYGIYFVEGRLVIAPALGKEVSVKGASQAIWNSSTPITYSAPYAYVSEVYSSNNRDNGISPFVNSESYLNVIFTSVAPEIIEPEPVISDFTPALPEPGSVAGPLEDWDKPEYFLRVSNKYGTAYVNRDFTVIPVIINGTVYDRTAIIALEACVRLANEQNVTEIFVKIPEGTEFSDNFTETIKVLKSRYGIEITVIYSE